MQEFKNEIRIFDFDEDDGHLDGYFMEVEESNHNYSFYISHYDFGTKEFLFSLSKNDVKEDEIRDIVMNNIHLASLIYKDLYIDY